MITAPGLIIKADSYNSVFCEFIWLIYVLLQYLSFPVSFLICSTTFLCCTKLSLQPLQMSQLLENRQNKGCSGFFHSVWIRAATMSTNQVKNKLDYVPQWSFISFIFSKIMIFTLELLQKSCPCLQEPIMPMDPSSVHPDNVESGKISNFFFKLL